MRHAKLHSYLLQALKREPLVALGSLRRGPQFLRPWYPRRGVDGRGDDVCGVEQQRPIPPTASSVSLCSGHRERSVIERLSIARFTTTFVILVFVINVDVPVHAYCIVTSVTAATVVSPTSLTTSQKTIGPLTTMFDTKSLPYRVFFAVGSCGRRN